jgi:hypothetical protein
MDERGRMKRLIILLVILGSYPAAQAQYGGLEYLQVPEGAINRIDTYVEANIENWGLQRVFVALPEGWKVSETALIDGTHSLGGTAYPVRFYATRYWELWGLPTEENTMLGRREVFDSNKVQDVIFAEVAGRQGWYLKPNEAIKVVFGVKGIALGGGIIDPTRLERENPNIRVVRWYQRFIMNVSKQGFVTAPWVILGAALTEATPAPYSAASGRGAFKYYVDFEKTVSAPKWDRWFELRTPLSYVLTPKPLAATTLEFPEIKKIGIVRPVFKVGNYRLITYAYEWKRDVKIEGWRPWRNDFADVPSWFEWF